MPESWSKATWYNCHSMPLVGNTQFMGNTAQSISLFPFLRGLV
jgi:hypothetical protein